MTTALQQSIRGRGRAIAVLVLPALAILVARGLTYTDWAAANTSIAALLFVWVAADSLGLAAIAKAPQGRAGLRAMLGAIAAGSVIAIVGAAAPVRGALLDMSSVLAAMALTGAIYVGWSASRFFAVWRAGASAEAALGEVFPPLLVRFWFVEARMMHLALFRWNAPPDVPAGTQGFAYHRYLTPMVATLLVLQMFELVVVHILLMLWSPPVAWAAFALSLAGVLWLSALVKSFRINPVLLTGDGVRVRSGALVDAHIPYTAIAGPAAAFTKETIEARTTLNTAILSWPNVVLTLDKPVAVPGLFGGSRIIDTVALKLDDSGAFLSALESKLSRCRADSI